MKIIRTILIVDDEPSLLKASRRQLETFCEVAVFLAPNLSIMRELLTRQVPDLVLMDGRIGAESGADGIRILRQWQVECPVVTHSNTESIIEEMLALGAIGSVNKPPTNSLVDDLRSVLNEAGFDIALQPSH